MRDCKPFLSALVCSLALAGGWIGVVNLTKTVWAQDASPVQSSGSGILDGMTFSGRIVSTGDIEVADKFVFARGTFESAECSVRCNYPAAPYFTRKLGNATEFVTELHCLDKDATMVWRGTIEKGTIKGNMTWTSERWYWTIEKKFRFNGTLTNQTTPVGDS